MTTVAEAPATTIEQDIVKQYQEESGFRFGTPPTSEQKMLAQKFGIMPPQLTPAENDLINRDRRHA